MKIRNFRPVFRYCSKQYTITQVYVAGGLVDELPSGVIPDAQPLVVMQYITMNIIVR